MGKLTDTAIRGALAPGRYADGNGLYLLVGPTRAKSFVFRFKVDGKERNMGLGPYPALTLSKARIEAQRRRAERAEGKDPLTGTRAGAAASEARRGSGGDIRTGRQGVRRRAPRRLEE